MKTTIKTSSLFILAVVVGLTAVMTAASVSQANTLSIVGVGTLQKVSYTDIPAGDSFSSSAKLGYGAGILIDHRLGRGVGFQFGALYVQPKAQRNESVSGVSVNDTFTRHMIQVPVTFQFHLMPGLSIGAGGYYAHTVSDNTTTDSSGNNSNSSDSAAGAKSYDLGAEGGVALHLPLSQSCHILADARYLQSFVNADTSGTVTTKPNGFQFMVGLTFGMGGMAR